MSNKKCGHKPLLKVIKYWFLLQFFYLVQIDFAVSVITEFVSFFVFFYYIIFGKDAACGLRSLMALPIGLLTILLFSFFQPISPPSGPCNAPWFSSETSAQYKSLTYLLTMLCYVFLVSVYLVYFYEVIRGVWNRDFSGSGVERLVIALQSMTAAYTTDLIIPWREQAYGMYWWTYCSEWSVL